jgi:hypothetical protein
MRVPVPYLHTTHVHTLADEVSVACLSLEFFFCLERQSSSPLSEVILPRGFLDLILVSVFVVCSLGTTSDWFCSMKFSLNCFSFLTK